MRKWKWLAALLALCLLSGLIPAAVVEEVEIDGAEALEVTLDGEAPEGGALGVEPEIDGLDGDGIPLDESDIDLSDPELALEEDGLAVANATDSLVRITKPADGATVNTGKLDVWCVFVNTSSSFSSSDVWKYVPVNYALLKDGKQIDAGDLSDYSKLIFVDDGIRVGSLTIPSAGSYILRVSVPGSSDVWDSVYFKAIGASITPSPTSKPTTAPTPDPVITTDADGFGVDQRGVLREYTGSAKDIVIPQNVKMIGENALAGKDIRSATLHGGITDILEFAFENCTALTNVKLAEGLKSIGDGAFYNTGLDTLEIPNTVTTIGDGAFHQSKQLTSLRIPASVTSMGTYMFGFSEKLKMVTFVKGSKLKSFGKDMFYSCTALEYVNIPDSVESLGEYAFSNCTALKSLILPDGLITIRDYAFENCTGLTELVIPASVGIMELHTFEGCSNLTLVVVEGSYAEQYARDVATIPYRTIPAWTPTVAPSASPKPSAKPTAAPKKTNLSKCKITVRDQVYTGKKLKPALTVKYGGKALKKGTDYTVSYKNNKAVGKATATIQGKGKYTGTQKVSFRILPPGVALTGVEAGTGSFTAKWKKSSVATGYQLQYGRKKGFSDAKTVKVKKAKTVSKTVKSLKSGKTYYVRIRAYSTVGKKTYYSAWSKTKSVKVK